MPKWGIVAVSVNAGIVLGALGLIVYDLISLVMHYGDN